MPQVITKVERYISKYEYPDRNIKPFFKVKISKNKYSNDLKKTVSKQCHTLKEAKELKRKILNNEQYENKTTNSLIIEENKIIIEEVKKLKVGEFYTLKRNCVNLI